VIVMGGRAEDNLRCCEVLDLQSSGPLVWRHVAKMRNTRISFAAGRLQDGRVIVAGGVQYDGGRRKLRSAEIYDPSSDAWSDLPEMSSARAFCSGACMQDGRFAVLGGRDDSGRTLSSCEAYDPLSGEWQAMAPMNQKRSDHAVCIIGPPGGQSLVVLGGRNSDFREGLKTVELLDLSTSTWLPVTPLRVPRKAPAVVCLRWGV